MDIELYKTDVKTKEDARYIVALLKFVISDCMMNFDMDESDPVLKIETNREIKEMVYNVLINKDFIVKNFNAPKIWTRIK